MHIVFICFKYKFQYFYIYLLFLLNKLTQLLVVIILQFYIYYNAKFM